MAVDGLGQTLDELLVIWMPGPRSHTGEDVVELSGHGNPVILSSVIDALVIAEPDPPGPVNSPGVLSRMVAPICWVLRHYRP